ncbi:acyl carrier protein [Candidatus Magnetominusculus xianensis]|uniref:Acyl carrier protein n=1 Tax=Candidatus Magnetominusculus xianensis TaxID=1748249 RepID=A0ABR5SIN6_9BACT|nr:acyl carrier protein [Candidatus Magnetominusculus xianensis]KWT91546.1 acyl carrier protein [Candidatus Magnetominusculus xianensis]MBF0404332.1 acyl carrier protein [Nitrospirota bacterium]
MSMLEKLQPIFREIFDDESIIITKQTTANDIEDWDSLTHINLIVAIEKHFNIKFALGELQSLQNVGEMLALIEEKVKKNE